MTGPPKYSFVRRSHSGDDLADDPQHAIRQIFSDPFALLILANVFRIHASLRGYDAQGRQVAFLDEFFRRRHVDDGLIYGVEAVREGGRRKAYDRYFLVCKRGDQLPAHDVALVDNRQLQRPLRVNALEHWHAGREKPARLERLCRADLYQLIATVRRLAHGDAVRDAGVCESL